jgi:uncharacterized protein Yka (UPF0111/DUF47 family)
LYVGEPEIQAKRKILAVLIDECRKSVDAIREFSKMIGDSRNADESYLKIKNAAEDVKGYRRALTRSLAELGSMIINKEDIMRAAYQIEDLLDLIEGTAFRLKQLTPERYSKYGLNDAFAKLTDRLIEMIIKLNDMVKMLQINPEKAVDILPGIELIEKDIDDTYRQTLVEAFNNVSDAKLYILIKDILERIDEISDLVLSISDSIMIVSIGL